MVDKLIRTNKNGALLFEPDVVYRIHLLQPTDIWYVDHSQVYAFAPVLTQCSYNLDIDITPHATHHRRERICCSQMSTETSLLHSITRSKLHGSINSKDQCSLHRWVLLRNSILSSSNLQDTTVSVYPEAISNSNEEIEEEEEAAEEEVGLVVDAFMFPDAGNFVSPRSADELDSEAQWLDSLLETLAEDEDDDYPSDSEVHNSTVLPVDEDDDQLFSPNLSPLASSEDLHQSRFYPSSVSVPYSTCFSPFDSSIASSYAFTSVLTSSAPSPSTAFGDALPYHDLDDIEDTSVPDAIEDASDDESDALSTPSFGRSITSLFLDSSSTPPSERSHLRNQSPSPYSDKRTRYLSPFELNALPFPDESSHHTSYSRY